MFAIEALLEVLDAGEHQREDEQHGDGAGVDEDLDEREELDGEQDIDAGDADERHDQEESGIDGAPNQDHTQAAREDCRRHEIEEK